MLLGYMVDEEMDRQIFVVPWENSFDTSLHVSPAKGKYEKADRFF